MTASVWTGRGAPPVQDVKQRCAIPGVANGMLTEATDAPMRPPQGYEDMFPNEAMTTQVPCLIALAR